MKIYNRFTKELIGDFDLSNLSNVNLSNADLSNAILYKANLSNTNLSNANLYKANLYKTNFSNANLSNAELFFANFSEANLSGINFSNANLTNADLSNANLSNANLSNAILYKANLSGAKNMIISILPEGNIIGYKNANDKVIKLLIPQEAKRVNSTGRKCRAEYVKALAILNKNGTISIIKTVFSDYDNNIQYTVGKMVYPDAFDDDIRVECSHGIHFFITFEEAVNFK